MSSLLCRERVKSLPSGNMFRILRVALPCVHVYVYMRVYAHTHAEMNTNVNTVNWKKQFAKQYIQMEPTHVFLKTFHTHAYLVKIRY